MKIRRLELIGFKSFKDRTVIHFDDGITGIVGPNGCGKSNIVDALTWVMGEQSSKHLRGTTMEDVIFNGSENFAPMGMAEVSLTIENDGGPFPAKWSKHTEVMMTRRLHRSGESEYFINKEPARLKDIVDIFMDTGAGSRGFSIVEQGQIGRIVTAKPDDRRTLIEEAAGITKFKVRKRESQRKLESTEQNLFRLNDIIGELRRQLDSLQRQAKRAERYKELKNQAQDLDLWISSKKYETLRAQLQQTARRVQELKDQETAGDAEYSKVVAELQEIKLQILEWERKVNAAQGNHFELQSQVQRKESQVQILEMEIANTKKNEELAGSLKTEIAARRDVLSRDLDHITTQIAQVSQDCERLSQESAQKTAVSEQAQSQAREADENLTNKRRELLTVAQGQTAMEVRLGNQEVQLADLLRRREDAEAVQLELDRKRIEFEGNRNRAFSSLESQRQMQLDIMKDVETYEGNLNILKQQAAEGRLESDNLKEELNKIISRLYGLETLANNFEGLKDGVKHIMAWQRERLQPLAGGGFELVADVVEVPKGYELAMEACLGDRLQSLLAPSADQSITAVDLLKEKNGGRSTFLSAELSEDVGPTEEDSSLSAMEGVKGYLKDIVRCPDNHQRTLGRLFKNVVVVDRLRTALALRPRYPKFTFVTIEGDVLSTDGSLTGGSAQAGDSGILHQKREMKELRLSREEISGKLALVKASLEKTEEQLASVTADFEKAQKQSFEQEVLIMERKKDLERAESEVKNAEEALRRQVVDLERVAAQVTTLEEQLVQTKQSLAEMTEKKQTLDLESNSLELKLNDQKKDLDRIAREATEAQIQSATKSKELEGLEGQSQKLQQSLAEAEGQLGRMSDDSVKNSQAIEQLARQVEEEKSTLGQLIDKVRLAEEELKEVRNQFEIQSEKARGLEQTVGEFQQVRNKNAQELNELQLSLSQQEMNEKYLLNQIHERYMVQLPDIMGQYLVREGDLVQAETELEDLRDKVKKIGEVNLTAIQEYEELSNRYEFLTKQHQDLIASMDSLRKVIDRINRICHRRFRDTFEAVNERFKKVFPVLFGGGQAELILIENPEGGEPGVEIMARPPGKKLQSVTLLSGGEKALTAVSLIFSIFLVKPSPFCLLDEVDAPLDDANVYRFNDLVKEMSRRSQIILVTHNKHTMSINNKLYGVTMEDPGVSKMVSVQLN